MVWLALVKWETQLGQEVCSQQEKRETMLSGESHPEHLPEQQKGPQTTLEASRKYSDQREKSDLFGRQISKHWRKPR